MLNFNAVLFYVILLKLVLFSLKCFHGRILIQIFCNFYFIFSYFVLHNIILLAKINSLQATVQINNYKRLSIFNL